MNKKIVLLVILFFSIVAFMFFFKGHITLNIDTGSGNIRKKITIDTSIPNKSCEVGEEILEKDLLKHYKKSDINEYVTGTPYPSPFLQVKEDLIVLGSHQQVNCKSSSNTFGRKSMLGIQGVYAMIEQQPVERYCYEKNYIILSCNVAQFSYLGRDAMGGHYGKDEENVYRDEKRIQKADAKTFQFLGWRFGKDKNHVYYEGNLVNDLDPKTFQTLTGEYVKDHDTVYYGQHQMPLADATTFEVLSDKYAKDKKYVYQRKDILTGKNPESFMIE